MMFYKNYCIIRVSTKILENKKLTEYLTGGRDESSGNRFSPG